MGVSSLLIGHYRHNEREEKGRAGRTAGSIEVHRTATFLNFGERVGQFQARSGRQFAVAIVGHVLVDGHFGVGHQSERKQGLNVATQTERGPRGLLAAVVAVQPDDDVIDGFQRSQVHRLAVAAVAVALRQTLIAVGGGAELVNLFVTETRY